MKFNPVIGLLLLALAVISVVLAGESKVDLEPQPIRRIPESPRESQRIDTTLALAVNDEGADDPAAARIQLVQFVTEQVSCRECGASCGQGTGFDLGCTTCCDQCQMASAMSLEKRRPLLRQSQLIPVNHPPIEQAPGPVKAILGVNEFVDGVRGREPTFQDSQLVPWEMFGPGEYLGPHRTPHVAEYRLRVNDAMEFVYYLSRRQTVRPYQVNVGDILQISSASDASLNQDRITVLSDGTISLPLVGRVRAASKSVSDLQDELNDRYLEFLKNPSILVQVIEGDTPLRDILNAVDARFGVGGQLRQAVVSPDGTVQLPVVGSIPAVGLTLDEVRREVNARYRDYVEGIEVTPILTQRAPRFIYVVGQVARPGRIELVGPTTVMQAIALAEGDLQGGNLRNIVVFRRDEAWRLTATRLDLAGAIHGRRPFPSDEIFLRDSDIVLIPRKPIQRLSEAVDLYLTRTLYSIFPENVVFDFDNGSFNNP